MKIGIILNSAPYFGGTFQYNETILEALNYIKNNEEKVDVVAAYDDVLWRKYLKRYDFKLLKTNLRINKAYIQNINIDELRKVLPDMHIGAKDMLKEKCDIWICPSQDVWSFLLDAPVLSTIHDLMHRYEKDFPEVCDDGEYEYRELLYSNMCKYSKGILVDSKCGKNQVIESYNINSEKINILPFIAPKYIFDCTNVIDVRKKYNIKGKYIFYPAQFWEHKNHINLVKAINIVSKVETDIKLVFSGSTKYSGYGKVLNIIRKYNLEKNVIFLGYVSEEEIVNLYKESEMLVMPTFFGPTNIPPLEAMALKCPMALSDVYGMREQSGKAALYFNPNIPDEIAQCILKILKDSDIRNKLIENCEIELEKHSCENFYKKLYTIIKKMIIKKSKDE